MSPRHYHGCCCHHQHHHRNHRRRHIHLFEIQYPASCEMKTVEEAFFWQAYLPSENQPWKEKPVLCGKHGWMTRNEAGKIGERTYVSICHQTETLRKFRRPRMSSHWIANIQRHSIGNRMHKLMKYIKTVRDFLPKFPE